MDEDYVDVKPKIRSKESTVPKLPPLRAVTINEYNSTDKKKDTIGLDSLRRIPDDPHDKQGLSALSKLLLVYSA